MRVLAIAILSFAPLVHAQEHVIRAGNEEVIGRILGSGEAVAGCALAEASIEATAVRARYACGAERVDVRLVHPDAAHEGVRSERFAITGAPPALARALLERARRHEGEFEWEEPERDRPDAPTALEPEGVPPEIAEEYRRGLALYRDGRYEAALEVYVALARREPRHGVLGMVVSSLASTRPSEERARELERAARAAPDDPLAAFQAAVAWHYWAHQSATDAADKRRGYRKTLELMAGARAAYDFEPRLHIYLAVSHFRLGRQREAEEHIERAVELGPEDPDVFYCRAEIRQRVDPRGAIEDVDRYIAMTAELRANGAVVSEEKLDRVHAMRRHLVAVSRGEASPDEIFDPAQGDEENESDALERAQIAIAWALLALALPALVLAARRAMAVIREGGHARYVLGAALAGAIARVAAPGELAMAFIGYRWTAQVAALDELPHYGAGAAVLDHALLAIFGTDHAVIVAANEIIGVASIPLAAAVATRWLGDARAGAIAAFFVALFPIFVRNDASEANHVPLIALTLGGLVLLDAWRASGARLALAGSAALLALASIVRPEAVLLVPAIAALSLSFAGSLPSRAALAVAGAALALVVIPHAIFVWRMAAELDSRGSLPGAALGPFALIGRAFETNAVLDPKIFPLAALPMAVLGIARGRRAVAIAIASLLAMLAVAPDLDHSNVARVHSLAALFAALLAAAGVARIAALPRGSWAASFAAAAIAATCVPNALALFAPTNEAEEEAFLREAAARLEGERGYDLVHIAHEDRERDGPDAGFTHDYVPLYLFDGARPRGIDDWLAQGSGRPAYALFGVRCYARFRSWGTAPPRGANLQPACARLRERAELEPIFERDVPNHGDRRIAYYGSARTLRVGLYRLTLRTSRTPR